MDENKYRVSPQDREKNEELKKQFILDATPDELEKAKGAVKGYIQMTTPDTTEREKVYRKRRDFFEGRHHLYSNVTGLRNKEVQGHILAVFNYVWRMSTRLVQALTNSPIRFKIKPEDEADEIESLRAESEENWISKILKDNHFYDIIFKRNSTIQVRDADFALKTVVEEGQQNGKQIKIYWAENMEKLHIIWDDAAGTSFSGVCYRDKWTLDKIAREFNGYKAAPIGDDITGVSEGAQGDEYGVGYDTLASRQKLTPSGQNKIPKAWVADYWGWFRVNEEGEALWRMCNIVMINDDVVQFIKTDYDKNPWIIGHSFDNPGSPYSISFIDNLIDAQVELNDRQSDEGDMIRIGSHQKFVVINMPKFDATSIKAGSGQVIYIEGENADFKPLETNVNPFPTDTYLNRTLEHLFTLGLPKIALSAGTAPYTGRVGVIQYQAVSDMVDELRIKWTPVMYELIKRIQSYSNQFFPETKPFMTSYDADAGGDVALVSRDVEFEWDSILPQSRSEGIVDAATLYDRSAIPTSMFLEMAGFRDPQRIIKQLKKEFADPEMVAIRKFANLSPGGVDASIEARQKQVEAEEANAETIGAIDRGGANQGSPPARSPILQKYQNTKRRGPPAGAGTPGVGATSLNGAANQVSQNIRAKE